MIFISNATNRINAEYIKELNINYSSKEWVFSLEIKDHKDNIRYLDVNIPNLLIHNDFSPHIKNEDFNKIVETIKDKSMQVFEQVNGLENALRMCQSKVNSTIKEIDIEEVVYQNAEAIISDYMISNNN